MDNVYLNSKLRQVKPSATLVINELSTKMFNDGIEVYRFGFGQSPFPVPKVIVKALRDNAEQKDYLPVKGLPALRKEIARFFREKYKLPTTLNEVMVGPGSKELIYNFQLAYNIEELLLPMPSWVSYEPQAQLNSHKVVWIETKENNNWKILPKDIIEQCELSDSKNRVIIFNYPSNPLGVTYSNNELKELANVFKKYNIIVIADEIYGEVHFDGTHETIAKYYPEGTIISTGLSKWAGAGGWRLGIFVFPKKLRFVLEAMSIIASETYTSTSAPIQYAAVEAYKEHKSLKIYLNNSRKILKGVAYYTYNRLIKLGVTMPKPEGGFYLYPNFNKWRTELELLEVSSSSDFCNVLLKKTRVALLPGEAFGHPKNNLTARLSFVDFNGTKLLKIFKQNPDTIIDDVFIETHCLKMVEGINSMESWLKSL